LLFQPFRETYLGKGRRVRRAPARELAEHGFHGRRQAHIKLGRIILENRFSKNLTCIMDRCKSGRRIETAVPAPLPGLIRTLWKAALPSRPKCHPCRLPDCSRLAASLLDALAASVTVNPSGSIHSWRTTRPGWSGFFMRMILSPFSNNRATPRRTRRGLAPYLLPDEILVG
jgi:hypothetical protein